MTNSPRPRRAKQMAPEERRQQLLQIAIHVFAQKSVDRAKHADIAKLAGVSPPTVFSYFPTREDLISAVLSEVEDHMVKRVISPTAQLETLEERMVVSGEALYTMAKTEEDLAKVWLGWAAYWGEPIRSEYLKFEARLIKRICAFLSGEETDDISIELHERARFVLMAAGFLCQMSIGGDSSERQEIFLKNMTTTVLSWFD